MHKLRLSGPYRLTLAWAPCLATGMPWICPETLQQLLRHSSSTRIVVPLYRGERGHPVIFGRQFWPAPAQLQGDQGGKQVIQSNLRACIMIEVDDPGVRLDVDTPLELSANCGKYEC